MVPGALANRKLIHKPRAQVVPCGGAVAIKYFGLDGARETGAHAIREVGDSGIALPVDACAPNRIFA